MHFVCSRINLTKEEGSCESYMIYTKIISWRKKVVWVKAPRLFTKILKKCQSNEIFEFVTFLNNCDEIRRMLSIRHDLNENSVLVGSSSLVEAKDPQENSKALSEQRDLVHF